MKRLFCLIFATLLFALGCKQDLPPLAHYTSESDTLILRTKKVKGSGLFPFGVGFLTFQDTSETFPHSIKYPDNINEYNRRTVQTNFPSDTVYLDILLGRQNGKEVYVIDENNNRDLTVDFIRDLKIMDWTQSEKGLVKVTFDFWDGTELSSDSSWLLLAMLQNNNAFSRNEHLEFKLG